MSSSSESNRPSLAYFRREARDLQRAFNAGDVSARDRVRTCLGASHAANTQPTLKLSYAQCVVARETGFISWRKMREEILSRPLGCEDGPDPLPVWYASHLLLGATSRGMLEFVLWKRGGELVVEGHGEKVSLVDFVRRSPFHDYSGYEGSPVPTDEVWQRLLAMADLTSPELIEGSIRLTTDLYPRTEWNIAVSRPTVGELHFRLELERVDTTPPAPTTGKYWSQSPGLRLMEEVRAKAGGELRPEAENALQEVAGCCEAAQFHRSVIREIADLVLADTPNLVTIVGCAHLVGTFGYHTLSLQNIARIAASCPRPCPDLSRLSELVVRRLSGTMDMVRLAESLVAAESPEDVARIREEIEQLDVTADFATLKEASEWQREKTGVFASSSDPADS
jgi:hypothetical protein